MELFVVLALVTWPSIFFFLAGGTSDCSDMQTADCRAETAGFWLWWSARSGDWGLGFGDWRLGLAVVSAGRYRLLRAWLRNLRCVELLASRSF